MESYDEPVGEPADEPQAPPPLSAQALARQRARRWRRRRRVIGVLAFLGVVVGLGVVVAMAARDGDSDPSVSSGPGDASSTTTTTLPPPAGPYEVTDGLNVRAGPATTYPVLAQIEVGNEVFAVCVIDGESVPGPKGATTKWLRIQALAISGYVTAQYVATGPDITSPTVIPVCAGI